MLQGWARWKGMEGSPWDIVGVLQPKRRAPGAGGAPAELVSQAQGEDGRDERPSVTGESVCCCRQR